MHKYHVTANVSISLGFPLGYFIINPLNESLIEYYDWRSVFRIYSVIIFFLILMVSPLFTDKYSNTEKLMFNHQEEVAFNDEFLNISSKNLSYLVRTLWLVGIVSNSIANTSILTHLVNFKINKINFKIFFSILEWLFFVHRHYINPTKGRFFFARIFRCNNSHPFGFNRTIHKKKSFSHIYISSIFWFYPKQSLGRSYYTIF